MCVEDTDATHSIKRVKYKDSDILASVKSLKAAKDSDDQTNTLYGTMSDDICFKGDRKKECFLADTGANLNIENSQENRGSQLDIVGECSFYVKMDIFSGRIKKMDAMVLCGNSVDQEVLVCGQLLKPGI